MEETIIIRHHLHTIAELSGGEQITHNVIVHCLKKCNATHIHTNVGGYGVVAAWIVGTDCTTIALRCDIDALPITETLDVDYKSVNKGVSHKCGHDGHTAILLNLAKMLSCKKLAVNVVLIFQPEEETGMGADKILRSKVLEQYNIDVIYGFHNLPHYDMGCVVLKKDTFAAASVGVGISLEGRATHAAHPENGINPANAIAEIILMMNKYNVLNTDYHLFKQSTLIYTNIGKKAFGTSPGEAEIMFTLRAFSNKNMDELKQYLFDTVNDISKKYNLATSMKLYEPFAAVENNNEVVDTIEQTALQMDMPIYWLDTPFRWSEDFAEYLKHYKGAFLGIGAGVDCLELHHPQYDFPDEIITTTSKLLYNIIVNTESLH